jgi:hydroxyethylthiazole kinase-like uncharacterized protein yjeF
MLGFDIIKVDRIKKAALCSSFLRVFSETELRHARKKADFYQSLAGIFAAKEAVCKAIGTGFTNIRPNEIEIFFTDKGQPFARITKEKSAYFGIDFELSISHDSGFAAAVAFFQANNREEKQSPISQETGCTLQACFPLNQIKMSEVLEAKNIILPPRKRNSHKGNYPSVMIIGGSKQMVGAPLLAFYSAAAEVASSLCSPQKSNAYCGDKTEIEFGKNAVFEENFDENAAEKEKNIVQSKNPLCLDEGSESNKLIKDNADSAKNEQSFDEIVSNNTRVSTNKQSFDEIVSNNTCAATNELSFARQVFESSDHLFALSKAAKTSGAGYVTLCVPSSSLAAYSNRVLEEMLLPLPDNDGQVLFEENAFATIAKKADSVVIGMGMGQNPALPQIIRYFCRFPVTLVLDADAINAISSDKSIVFGHSCTLVLTPHIGEYKRLFPDGKLPEEDGFLEDFMDNALSLGAVIALKSHITFISDGVRVYRSDSGTAAMAKGGSGDVLSGLVGVLALRMQTLEGTAFACYVSGKSGEAAEREKGSEGVLASDLILFRDYQA